MNVKTLLTAGLLTLTAGLLPTNAGAAPAPVVAAAPNAPLFAAGTSVQVAPVVVVERGRRRPYYHRRYRTVRRVYYRNGVRRVVVRRVYY